MARQTIPSGNPFVRLDTLRRLATGRLPGQVVIQYTERCNADCAQCGMRRSNAFKRSTLDQDRVRRLIDSMAAKGVRSISFTGGEPLLCLERIAPLIRHARRAGIPYTRTGTNGYVFAGADKPGRADRIARVADALAEAGVYTFWISLDSADPSTHERNRGLPGVAEGLARGLEIFHRRGLYPAVNLGINRCTGGPEPLPRPVPGEPFDEAAFRQRALLAFNRFYLRAAELGFTMANACYPMRGGDDADTVYRAASLDDRVNFTPREKKPLFEALTEAIHAHRSRLRIFSPLSALLALRRQYGGDAAEKPAPCRGGVDFFFIGAANMDTFPCGYRGGENLGKFWDMDLNALGPDPDCLLCDWECFRDPSEMAWPLTGLFRSPVATVSRLARDREWRRTWLEDLRYYRACGFFDGREPPDRHALARFART
ncbi:radical SAM protein [Desulfohalovibrio reitneri]|uniref:radical SAM protein n=1 Tax=Desulfohalovibrio reitneri TaxID=1307759 RepID=UPI0009DCB96E|nr:radical SAM protein [Desulfohalovibrio reitneri]